MNTKGCEIRVGGDNAPYYRDRKLRLRRREQLGRRMRDILGMTAITIGLKAKPSFAAGPPRALSDVASKIPGYGMADLFFPSYFEGTWDCISDLVDIQMPLGEEMVPNLKEVKTLQRFIGRPEMLLRFNQTYFRYRDHVIAERGANTVSARIAKRFNPETNTWYSPPSGSDGVADAITDVRWEPSNPNVLNYVMNPGQKYEVLVTKRAFEQPAENVFITSEVVRQTQTDLAQMSPPVVKQVKDQVKYKRVAGSEPETIQAILISNVILTPEGDQLEDYLRSGGKPVTTYRTRILMTKLS
eukprot:jgi/Bigna1/142969/aug1.74_g17677